MIQTDIYTAFARHYDKIMAHVDYPLWARYIQKLIRKYKLPADEILDLGGGTGSLALELHQLGYRCDLLDGSAPMIERARVKLSSSSPQQETNYFHQDLRQLKLPAQYSLALCLHDTINYIRQKRELHAVFKGIAASLQPGGHLIMDNCSEYNILQNFSEREFSEELKGVTYIWRNFYYPRRKQAVVSLEMAEHQPPYQIHQEKHIQQLHSDETLFAASEPWFDCLAVLNGFTMQPAHAKTEEIYYIFRKK